MGADEGDRDEGPPRRVFVSAFWAADVALTETQRRALTALAWPTAAEAPTPSNEQVFLRGQAARIQRAYSLRNGPAGRALDLALVALGWEETLDLCNAASLRLDGCRYRLPTEAEWEKAARGGLARQRDPWGDDAPTELRADFERLNRESLCDPRQFPPNGYGLHAMAGSVWEWCLDWYDAEAYAEGPTADPRGPVDGRVKVLRGGSWADCEAALRVSFRWALAVNGAVLSPCVGARLVRVPRSVP
jgi:formylglycine-generating enzyme required for sulfatase activity